jgi:hypothetical protein
VSRVVVEDGFAQYGRAFDRALRIAIIEGAEATLHAAQSTVPRGETGRLARSIHLGPLIETLQHLRIEVYAGMFYGKFVEFGTLGRRKKAVTRGRSAASQARAESGQGIAPRYFMLKAGRKAAPMFAAAVARHIRSLG